MLQTSYHYGNTWGAQGAHDRPQSIVLLNFLSSQKTYEDLGGFTSKPVSRVVSCTIGVSVNVFAHRCDPTAVCSLREILTETRSPPCTTETRRVTISDTQAKAGKPQCTNSNIKKTYTNALHLHNAAVYHSRRILQKTQGQLQSISVCSAVFRLDKYR